MTTDDRITSLHQKINELRVKQERQKTVAYGAGSIVLTACVIMLIINVSEGTKAAGGTAGLYSGATMLFENAGGYVAAAIAAFMVGVIVTVICIKQRTKHEKEQDKEPDREGKR